MSKRSNGTRGNRVLSRGTALRARQMVPRHTGRGGSIRDVLIPPDVADTLITEALDPIVTEDGIWMAPQ